MQGRNQVLRRQTEGLSNEPDIIIDQRRWQRALTGCPVEACCQRFTEKDPRAARAEVPGDPKHKCRLAAEGFTGSDQQR